MWGCNLGAGVRVCKVQGERGKPGMTDAEFAARVIAMQDTLYRVSTTILPRLCDREDAVQSAIEKALRRRGRLRDAAALEKWLTRILINECYTIHRRRRREVLSGDPAARETAPDADTDLYRLFTSLPEAYRLPKATPEEQAAKNAALQQALVGACDVPSCAPWPRWWTRRRTWRITAAGWRARTPAWPQRSPARPATAPA